MSRVIDLELLPAAAPAAVTSRPEPAMPGACASGGCGGGPVPPRPPAPSFAPVTVNGVEISAELIAREMQHHPGPDVDVSWRAAASALALRELLVQEARRQGLATEPDTDESGAVETEEDALVRALLEQEVQVRVADADECRRVYEAERHRFRTPDLFEASHILIEADGDDEAAWDAAAERARVIATEVGDDREAFAAAAREFSKCPSAHQGGSLGQVRRGDLVAAVQNAFEALAPGTTGRDPVRSRFGWHVVRLERRIDGRVLPFEAVQAKIADMLEARAWATASVHYLASLARDAAIEGVELEPASGPAGVA